MHRQKIIDLQLEKLATLPRSVAVEVAYLIVRFLSHRFTETAFRAQLSAEDMLPYQQQAIELAVEMVAAIAEAEGGPISRLSKKARQEYEQGLAQAILNGGATDLVDRRKVDAALQELTGIA